MEVKERNWVGYLLLLIAVSFGAMLLGELTGYRPLLLIGFTGLAIWTLVCCIALLGGAYGALASALPKFRGKDTLILALVLILGGIMLWVSLSGSIGGPCFSARWDPNCDQ